MYEKKKDTHLSVEAVMLRRQTGTMVNFDVKHKFVSDDRIVRTTRKHRKFLDMDDPKK